MKNVSRFLSRVDAAIYERFFITTPTPFASHETPFGNALYLSSDLEERFNQQYEATVISDSDYSAVPYAVFRSVAKGLGIPPFDSTPAKEAANANAVLRMRECERLSIAETWAIIAFLYLTAQTAPNFDAVVEKIRRGCRVPESTSEALKRLVLNRDWNCEMRGRQLWVESAFCEQATALVAQIVKPEITRLTPLTGLVATSYQHPADRAILQKLAAIPGVGAVVGKAVDLMKRSQELFLLANQELVTPLSHPRLYKLIWLAAQILDLKKLPAVFIDSSLPGINAYTTGTQEKAYVALSKEAAFLLDDREFLYLIGHEFGHIQCDHVHYHAAADAIIDASSLVPGVGAVISAVQAPLARPALSAWLRCAELSADRAGLLCCQNREAALRVLIKISGRPWSDYRQISTRSFVDQATRFQEARSKSKLDTVFELFNRLYASHPYLVYRASELLQWMQNAEYDEHVETDANGRQTLARRAVDDAFEQTALKAAENALVDWCAERSPFMRREIARDARKMIYENEASALSPLDRVGRVLLEIEQVNADEFHYHCVFYVLDENDDWLMTRVRLDIESGRDYAPARVRDAFLRSGKTQTTFKLYEVQ
ncbi:MAG: M48 family metallopeptidase [Thermoguttaceae bacterium]|nr:M48 family metallopeptidase [Thermoguttaceae bacterium]MBR4105286.1 M48 family metallopeptidase [Thermoguttaceae bacterium]